MADMVQIEQARKGRLVRRNIHTYPFKYGYTAEDVFFEPDLAAIYIHIPFCSTKCHFCDYTVYVNAKQDLRRAYVAALKNEIARFPSNPAFPTFRIDAVYFGGGTPGLLEGEELVEILNTCRETFPFVDSPEIAIEFDPASVEEQKLARLKEAGFTRMSIGVQSFDNHLLKGNNRPHDRDQVYRAVEIIRRTGFDFYNIDLIYPLLGLDLQTWQRSLEEAIALEPACITAYPLEVWPKTAYHSWIVRQGAQLPSNADELAMANMAFDMLEGAGFVTGSTSGYYRPDRTAEYCRFLSYYWRTWPMIGFGVSSKSVIHDRLYTNVKPLRTYIERIEEGRQPLDFSTRLTKDQEMRRVIIRGLKVGDVSRSAFLQRFGVAIDLVFGEQFRMLERDGFLVDEGDVLRLTRKGQLFSNNVWESFYSADDLRPPSPGEVQFGISELVLN